MPIEGKAITAPPLSLLHITIIIYGISHCPLPHTHSTPMTIRLTLSPLAEQGCGMIDTYQILLHGE